MEALQAVVAPDNSLTRVVKAALGYLGNKLASDAGETMVHAIASHMGRTRNAATREIPRALRFF